MENRIIFLYVGIFGPHRTDFWNSNVGTLQPTYGATSKLQPTAAFRLSSTQQAALTELLAVWWGTTTAQHVQWCIKMGMNMILVLQNKTTHTTYTTVLFVFSVTVASLDAEANSLPRNLMRKECFHVMERNCSRFVHSNFLRSLIIIIICEQ